MVKTLEEFGYRSSLVVDGDYMIGVLQSALKDKKGFLEIRQPEAIPVYKIENNKICAIAVMGINPNLMDLLLEKIEREDILKSFASLNKDREKIKVAFYNKNQPIDKMLRFYEMKNPIALDDKFFIDLVKYI
ncbi:MAG: hypothetical protein N3G19_02700 [Candidatus Pacearchaeota archaeon]|nr:hypothetical protein [Candidatus Pacearchaeota archaeon]